MRFSLLIPVVTFLAVSCKAQEGDRAGLLFYNVENLMDTIDNPVKLDDEFTPTSEKQWNTDRYYTKLDRIGQVVVSAGVQLPAVIGLCEIENRDVLEDLVAQKDMLPGNYGIVQFDSPDERGIDCALLYSKDQFTVKDAYTIPVYLPADNGGSTRDILYVNGVFNQGSKKEVVHMFVNHWPSRSEGEEITRSRRAIAAGVLKKHVDSLNALYIDPAIVIMGDFNDTPFDESVLITLGALAQSANYPDESLVNLVHEFQKNNEGSYNFKGNWQTLDQLIVSEGMLTDAGSFRIDQRKVKFVKNDFQLYHSDKYGDSPNRTYGGPKYYGGYSDHLPVYMELILR